MTYIIAEPCIDQLERSCIAACPVDCIYELSRQLVIEPDECIDCGACEPECPVQAIFAEDAVPAEWNRFVAINAAYRQGPEAAEQLLQAYLSEARGAQAACDS